MYQSLAVFQTAQAMAQHAGAQQAVTARNVANADTPTYRAERLPDFAEVLQRGDGIALRRTRPAHLQGTPGLERMLRIEAASEPGPNGNSVSIEDEMLAAIDAGRNHSRALAIYRHAMTLIRTSLGR